MINSCRAIALAAVGQMPVPLGYFIEGRSASGTGPTFLVTEPATGKVLSRASDAIEAEPDAAVAAAKAALPDWSAISGIAAVECLDAGQCWRFMSKAATRGADNFRFFADQAPSAVDAWRTVFVAVSM